MKLRALTQKQAMEKVRSMTPEAMQGRQHVDVQTGETFEWTLSDLLAIDGLVCNDLVFIFRALS